MDLLHSLKQLVLTADKPVWSVADLVELIDNNLYDLEAGNG